MEAPGRQANYHSGLPVPGSHKGTIRYRSVSLKAGELFVTLEPCLVKTVLGSCVSVFLWDPVLRSGGVNHYPHPKWNGKDAPGNKYGDVAISNLVKRMLALGSRAKELQAKVFGGGSGKDPLGASNKNVSVAFEVLEEEGIPVISSCVGEDSGRNLVFNTYTGIVGINRIRALINNRRS